MWSAAPSTPSTSFAEMMASRYSVDQSASLAGMTRGSAAEYRRVAAYLAAGIGEADDQRPQQPVGSGAIDQQCLGGTAHAGAPQFGVDAGSSRRHREVGRLVDVDVADALEVREHRHPRFRSAPARRGFSRRAARSRRSAPSSPASISPTAARSPVGTSWIAACRQPGRGEAVHQAGVDRALDARLSEPPRRIAALPALRQSPPASAVTFGRLS